MKKTIAVLALAVGMPTGFALAQPDGGPPPPEGMAHGREFRPEGPGRPGGFRLLPPHAERQLELTPEQHRQLAALAAEVKTKLEGILTVTQMRRLKEMAPPGMGRGPGHEGRFFGDREEPEGLPGGPGEPGWHRGHAGMGGPEAWDRPGDRAGLPGPGGPEARRGRGGPGGIGDRTPPPAPGEFDRGHDRAGDPDRATKGHGPADKADRDADGRVAPDEAGPPHHRGPGRDDDPAAEGRRDGPAGHGAPGADRPDQSPPEKE